jgi:uncharacterized protein (TIGR02145 family)
MKPLHILLITLLTVIACEKEENDDNNDNKTTITDIDGNVYDTVVIGTQTWMVQNLKVTRYRNGDAIGTTSPAILDISGESAPKYQWAYEGIEDSVETYGRLYTWYTVIDSRNLCPSGWHVPSNSDLQTLQNYLIENGYNYDGTTTDNKIAKSLASSYGWISTTVTGAVGNSDFPDKRNITGFTALPGGYRLVNGTFGGMGSLGDWWISNESTADNDYGLFYTMVYIEISAYGGSVPKDYGLSVRCLKD